MTTPLGQRARDVLSAGGIATKDGWMGGSTGCFTFYGPDAAEKAARLFRAAKFRTRGPIKSLDECVDQSDRKTLHPKYVTVWRVGVYA